VGEVPWFIAHSEDWRGDEVMLDPEESHHALHVLRVPRSAPMWISDGGGSIARCSLDEVRGDRVVAKIIDKQHHPRPLPEVVVYQAAPKAGKLDEVVEHLAQLGVAELRVFDSSRTVVRWNDDKRHKVAERWRAIARGAAKQSRNPFVMRTGFFGSWADLISNVADEGHALALWEGASISLRERLPIDPQRLALIVGPEGGFAAEEADQLGAVGAEPVSLGPRIFRTEMAPVVACCSLLWHYCLIG
jgi:16S rRNA (uracil1498-N3)-methyltransferase